jgi:lysophospholipase L1-like esterase
VGWFAIDADNKVVARGQNLVADQPFAFNVTMPPDAVKLFVNAYGNENAYVCNYTEQKTASPEIKTNMKIVGGDLSMNLAYKYDKTTSEGNYAYIQANVDEGEYYITGRNMGKNFPLFLLLDSNDNVIYFMGEATEYSVKDYKITLPSGTKKLIVNSTNSLLPMIKKYVPSENYNLANELATSQRERTIDLVSLNPEITYGSVMKRDKTTAANASYMHTVCPVVGGGSYYITGRNYSYNFPMVMFLNGNGNVCYSTGNDLAANAMYFDMRFEAPLDAVSVVVNSIKGADIDVKVPGTDTLYNTLLNRQITGVYIGETPTKAIEYTLTNGAWVYDSVKAERNLTKFGFAYATMLERIMKTYPLATVICCTLNETERTTDEIGFPERNKSNQTIRDYIRVVEELAKAFGCLIVDHHACGITYYNLSEYMYDYASATGFGLHPNAAGMALIARQTIKDLSGVSWTGKKVSVFGDSISTYTGTGSTPNQYPNGDVDSVNKMWWHISLIAGLGMTLHTNASGGGRTVSTTREGIEGRPKSGCNQDAINALAVNNVAPDVIIIKQGINDFGNVGASSNLDLNGHYYYGGL